MFKYMYPSVPYTVHNTKIAIGSLWVHYEDLSFLQNNLAEIGLRQKMDILLFQRKLTQ